MAQRSNSSLGVRNTVKPSLVQGCPCWPYKLERTNNELLVLGDCPGILHLLLPSHADTSPPTLTPLLPPPAVPSSVYTSRLWFPTLFSHHLLQKKSHLPLDRPNTANLNQQ